MLKLHGVRFIEGIKIFVSMLKKPTVSSNKTARIKFSTFNCCSINVCCAKISGSKNTDQVLHLSKLKYKLK